MPDTTPPDMTTPEHAESLTKTQFDELLGIIEDGHRFTKYTGRALHCKHIKYITPIFDLRDSRIFQVEFRGLAGDKLFDFRDGPRPMYDRIKEWLENKEEKSHADPV